MIISAPRTILEGDTVSQDLISWQQFLTAEGLGLRTRLIDCQYPKVSILIYLNYRAVTAVRYICF